MSSKRIIHKRFSSRQRQRKIKEKVGDMMNILEIESKLTKKKVLKEIVFEQTQVVVLPEGSGPDTNNQPKSCDILGKILPNNTCQLQPTGFFAQGSQSTFIEEPKRLQSDLQEEIENTLIDVDSHKEAETFLTNWGKRYNIPHIAMTDLLKWLKSNPYTCELPTDARTLFKTPRETNIIRMGNDGQFYYFGLTRSLTAIYFKYKESYNEMNLFFNVDGIPIHKNSRKQFWPILCQVENYNMEPPFVVALYLGNSKPPLQDFFADFVDELQTSLRNGLFVSNKFISLNLKAFCCDAPARSFIKNVKGHNSYYGCDFCVIKGEYYQGRMTYCKLNEELRTDHSFTNNSNEEHHKGQSPLEKLPLGLITNFPNDYMHSVCLGLVRKILFLWRDKGRGYGIKNLEKINSKIICLKLHWPVDFNRKPQSIADLEHWKATELRQFLLYVAPVVLPDNVPKNVLANFMILTFAMSILLHTKLNRELNAYAEKLLKLFVKHAVQIYGKSFCVYNTHSIIHLAPQAKIFDSLNVINCFSFENFLGSLKRLLRKPGMPLAQVVRRYQELGDASRRPSKTCFFFLDEISFSKAELLIRTEDFAVDNHKFYSKYHYNNGNFFSNKRGNNCIFLKSGSILKVLIFTAYQEDYYCIGNPVEIIRPLIDYPSSSEIIFKFDVTIDESRQQKHRLNGNILHKGVFLPTNDDSADNKYICFALLHDIIDH